MANPGLHGHLALPGEGQDTSGLQLWELLQRMKRLDECRTQQDLQAQNVALEAKRRAALDAKHAQQLNRRLQERVATGTSL